MGRGRLAVWAGAATSWGPVSHYLGLLAARLGRTGDAVRHFQDAIEFEPQTGTPALLAHSLAGLAAAQAARDDTGDAAQASQYRRRARQVVERLGMAVLLQRLGRRPMSGR